MKSLLRRKPDALPVTNYRLGLSDVFFACVLALLFLNDIDRFSNGILEYAGHYYYDSLQIRP